MTLLVADAARADGDAARGEKKFGDCAACHKLEAGANNVGPSLHGIFTRKAGELADFRYSPAMKRSGITWSPETLDKFIADPQAMVPANRMPYAGIADAGDRADLIAYLQKATQ
jgi:cytochrome c